MPGVRPSVHSVKLTRRSSVPVSGSRTRAGPPAASVRRSTSWPGYVGRGEQEETLMNRATIAWGAIQRIPNASQAEQPGLSEAQAVAKAVTTSEGAFWRDQYRQASRRGESGGLGGRPLSREISVSS